jgi:hypothetical protein
VDVFQTTQDSCCEFGSEGIPDAIFCLGCDGDASVAVCGCCGAGGGRGGVDGDALFAVDCFAWREVLGYEKVFFTTRYEDARMSVWFL